jgi:hypothetical protein
MIVGAWSQCAKKALSVNRLVCECARAFPIIIGTQRRKERGVTQGKYDTQMRNDK